VSEEANSEPEPIEDRIARAIEETLEPFVVSLLAALIAPSQCAQGFDQERDDQRGKAIETGRMLLDETRKRLKGAHEEIERVGAALEAHKSKPAEECLYLDMKLGDDSFRRHLRELKAPKKIQDLDAMAHYRALVKLNLGALLIADRAVDGDLFGYWITKRVAVEYLALERKAGSDAVAKSRKKQ
jgi:hypothetical protein